jgi:RES domain-containing protein
MEVYNIRRAKFASSLTASGVANRWNKNEEFVIYAGANRALATLENLAHRSFIHSPVPYKLLTIEMKVDLASIREVQPHALPANWRSIEAYPELQEIGSGWYQRRETLLLKVPSVIVPQEYNYLINTQHKQFSSWVKIVNSIDFILDDRLL